MWEHLQQHVSLCLCNKGYAVRTSSNTSTAYLSGCPPFHPIAGKEYIVGSVKQFKILPSVSPHLSLVLHSIMPHYVFLPLFSTFLILSTPASFANVFCYFCLYSFFPPFIPHHPLCLCPPRFSLQFPAVHSSSLLFIPLLFLPLSPLFLHYLLLISILRYTSCMPPQRTSCHPFSFLFWFLSLSLPCSVRFALPAPFRQFILCLTLDTLKVR